MMFINVSFADPENFFENLIFDNDGNLVIPGLKVGKLTIDSSVQIASGAPSLQSDNIFYDLRGKIASLEDRIKINEEKLSMLEASSSATPAQSTPSATIQPNYPSDSLTDPTTLLASNSASFHPEDDQPLDGTFTSDVNLTSKLSAYEINVSEELKVLGNTTLGNTLIAGELTVDGTLSISGNSINAVSTLYLQSSILAENLDIFNGKVVIDKSGNITSTSITTDQIKINSDTSIGEGTIVKGETQIIIQNNYVDENSIIFITPKQPLNQALAVTDKNKKSFNVKLNSAEDKDIKFDYLIISIGK